MRRLAGVLLASGMLALGAIAPALAAPTTPEPTAPAQPRTHAVAARAHLIFRSGGREATLEGRVTVVEHPTGTMVLEQIAPACESDCARRRLALMAADSPSRE